MHNQVTRFLEKVAVRRVKIFVTYKGATAAVDDM